MHIVFEDKHGEIKWHNKLEVESLEEFAKATNRRAKDSGIIRDTHFVDSNRKVRVYSAKDGSLEGIYHVCDAMDYRLL
jgi:hypothetical protein